MPNPAQHLIRQLEAYTTQCAVDMGACPDPKAHQPTRQRLAFWRITLNRHDDGISATFRGPIYTYQTRITRRERNNW